MSTEDAGLAGRGGCRCSAISSTTRGTPKFVAN